MGMRGRKSRNVQREIKVQKIMKVMVGTFIAKTKKEVREREREKKAVGWRAQCLGSGEECVTQIKDVTEQKKCRDKRSEARWAKGVLDCVCVWTDVWGFTEISIGG